MSDASHPQKVEMKAVLDLLAFVDRLEDEPRDMICLWPNLERARIVVDDYNEVASWHGSNLFELSQAPRPRPCCVGTTSTVRGRTNLLSFVPN